MFTLINQNKIRLVSMFMFATLLAPDPGYSQSCRGNGQYQGAAQCIRQGYNGQGYPYWQNTCGQYINLQWCYRDGGQYSCASSGNAPTQFTGMNPGVTYVNWAGRPTTWWAFVCN